MDETQVDAAGRLADRAMGLELEAVDLEVQLEWAESQGRLGDAEELRERLAATLDALANLVEGTNTGGHVEVRAHQASDAA